MTEEEYKGWVLADLDQKLAAGQLPELLSPKRKSLKALSVKACTQRFEPKDEPLLSSFFEPKEDHAAYVKALQLVSSERFRTLNNFLHDREIDTDFENVRLLAWLIDFQPRPYHPGLKTPERPKPAFSPPTPTGGTKPPTPPEEPPKPKNRKLEKQIALYTCIGLMIMIGGYWALTRKTMTGNEHCMYWDTDHYQPISCNEKTADTSLAVIPLDSGRLRHFKRITQADTLTAASIGKVWYARIGSRSEFYTAPGQHPLQTDIRLLPLTAGILNSTYGSR